jgi:hypothetical protein
MVAVSEVTRAQCLKCVKINGDALEFMHDQYKADIEIVSLAILTSPMALSHASAELRGNKELMRIAFRTHPRIFLSATAVIKNDRPFIEELIQMCHPDELYFIIENIPRALLDKEMGLRVARKCVNLGKFSKDFYYVLSCLPDHVRQDKEVVLAAIKNGNRMGRFILNDPLLRSDEDVMKEVIRSAPSDFLFMSRVLIDRYDMAWFAMETNGALFRHLSEEYRADPNFFLLALKTSPCELQHASAELQANKKIAAIAVAACGANFYHISEELKTEPELVKGAVMYDAKFFKWVSWKIKTHPCLQLFAILTAKCPYDRDSVIHRNDFLFRFSVDRMAQVFHEKSCFMMSSHVKWGPIVEAETTCKRAVYVQPPILKLNDQGPFMALVLKRRISAFLGIDMFWNTDFENEVAKVKAAAARDPSMRPRLCQVGTALELDSTKMKAAAIFAHMLNEACAARNTTAFKELKAFINY